MRDLQEWRKFGKCKNLSPEEATKRFFLGRGGSPRLARELCDTCPVRQECLDYAILYNEDGIWAGTTEKERKILTPYLLPALKVKAEQEGRLEERQTEPIVLRQFSPVTTESPYDEDAQFDIYLSTLPLTGS